MDLRQILLKSKGVVFLKLMCQLNVLITDTDDEKSFLNVTIVYFPITFSQRQQVYPSLVFILQIEHYVFQYLELR